MRSLVAAAALFLLSTSVAISASAVEVTFTVRCFDRAILLTQLYNIHGETIRARFVNNVNVVYELFGSVDGDWTMAFTMPESPNLLCGFDIGPILELKKEPTF